MAIYLESGHRSRPPFKKCTLLLLQQYAFCIFTFYPHPSSIILLRWSVTEERLILTLVLYAGTQRGRRGLRPSQQLTTEEPWWAQEVFRTSRLDKQLGITASLCSFCAFDWVTMSCLPVPNLRAASGHHPGVRHHRREVLRKHPELDEEHQRGEGSVRPAIRMISVLIKRTKFHLIVNDFGCNNS